MVITLLKVVMELKEELWKIGRKNFVVKLLKKDGKKVLIILGLVQKKVQNG